MSEETQCDCGGVRHRTCPVLREFRILMKEDGAKLLMEEYREQLRARARERGEGDTPNDTAYRLQKLGVPSLAILALRDNPQNTPALEAARKFTRVSGPLRKTIVTLLLVGDRGVGKTVGAAHVVWDFARSFDWNGQPTSLEAPPPAMWVAGSEFTRLSSYNAGDALKFRQMKGARLLVIDDLGEESTDAGRAAAIDILKARDGADRRTVITSNAKPEAFRRVYGDPLADRIAARGLVPNLAGKSLRKPRKDAA